MNNDELEFALKQLQPRQLSTELQQRLREPRVAASLSPRFPWLAIAATILCALSALAAVSVLSHRQANKTDHHQAQKTTTTPSRLELRLAWMRGELDPTLAAQSHTLSNWYPQFGQSTD